MPAILLVVAAGQAPLEADISRLCWIALAVMVFAELTDGVDGFVARRFGLVSSVGKLLDPLADSLYRNGMFIAFAAIGWMPFWMLVVFASRDLMIAHLRLVSERRIGTLAARSSGKLKAISQSAAQLAMVAAHALWASSPPDWAVIGVTALLYLALGITLLSLYDYLSSVWRALKAQGAAS